MLVVEFFDLEHTGHEHIGFEHTGHEHIGL